MQKTPGEVIWNMKYTCEQQDLGTTGESWRWQAARIRAACRGVHVNGNFDFHGIPMGFPREWE